jgi:DNA repair exonuclease SbcCD ATPase subunit
MLAVRQSRCDAAQQELRAAEQTLQAAAASQRAKRQSWEETRERLYSQSQSSLDALLESIAEEAASSVAQEHVEFWRMAFGPKGIRAYRMEQVVPFLNRRAAFYSNKLFGDGTALRYGTRSQTKKGEWREQFDAALYQGDARLDAGLSAGQSMRRDIVHAFTMAEAAERLAKCPVGLLAFDEVFRTLDAAGVEAVMQLLRAYAASHPQSAVLVIEHNEDLRAGFDRVIEVERNGGVSSVRLTTS